MRVGGSQSTVDPDFALEFIATEKDGQQAGWIDQTTDEDRLLPLARGAGYKLSREFPYHSHRTVGPAGPDPPPIA